MVRMALIAHVGGAVEVRDVIAAGAEVVLASPTARLTAAVRQLPAGTRPEIWALVPDPLEYLRDSSEAGPMGAVLKRLKRATAGTVVRLAGQSITRMPRLLAREFGALLAVLLELELAGFRGLAPSHIVLAAPWTDLALAAGNRKFFEFYGSYVAKHHRASPGLETWNGGHLLPRLREWGSGIGTVLTAVNPNGFRMKPSRSAALAEISAGGRAVFARDVTAGEAVSIEEGVAFARASGVAGIVVEVNEGRDLEVVRSCRALLSDSGSTRPPLAREAISVSGTS
jgi:hypothetical protein